METTINIDIEVLTDISRIARSKAVFRSELIMLA
jgi:hypothetical protein